MARHRNVRNRSYSDDYDYDDVYGHSVEEDSCLSPNDSSQWLFDRTRNSQAIAHFLDSHDDIQEEVEEDTSMSSPSALQRGESIDLRSLDLSEEDEAKLMSCLDELRNVLGDTVSESVLIKSVLHHKFDFNKALDDILNSKSKENTKTEVPKLPLVVIEPAKAPVIATVNTPKVIVQNLEPKTLGIIKGFKVGKDEGPSSRPGTPREQSPCTERSKEQSTEKVKAKENKASALSQYTKERALDKEHLYIVVIGHVDAGKSTLMGRLLCDLGEVSQKTLHKYEQESKKIGKQSFMYAWVLDETGEERVRGITMDVGRAQFETKTKKVVILDAPGHADFIPNMITGAGQADVALLVIDATRGEFESGFDFGGQTREHALLVRSLGVSQLAVAVNKLDTSNWSQERFDEITKKLKAFLKQAGFKDSDVTYVPCSGLNGENLVKPPSEPELLKWYKGLCLLDVIDKFSVPDRPISKPLRMSINDVFKGTGSGFCVAGRIENGMISKGDKVIVCPTKEAADVRGVSINDMSSNVAFAGDQVIVTLSGVDMQNVSVGYILSDPVQQVPVTTRFEARIVVFNVKVPITKGYPILIHYQSLVESAHIVKLKAQLNKTTGELVKKKPRVLGNNSVAVVEIEVSKPICIEKYKDVKELGRVMLRVAGVTIAAGLVTDIMST
ncbi:Eukaryotic peptide chain release factor GTP-binding subunit [Operophtera brumata]|uniref:Eukaryotic peptide chain release factor GTP-binding subunit n=1 Tax=Operophtera brumata TaxID=104452 RepID=A0A0L7KNV7_OPEBR|nr:Eukaryotic peptide chain release factor GTP-binding subunit [Operophtera brumata]